MNSAADKFDLPPESDSTQGRRAGPEYVHALPPPPASSKALGVTCIFFGMVVSIGAFAALTSGRFNSGAPRQSIRHAVVLGLGMMLFLAGTQLLKRSRQK